MRSYRDFNLSGFVATAGCCFNDGKDIFVLAIGYLYEVFICADVWTQAE